MPPRKIKTPPLSDLLPTGPMSDYAKRSSRTLHRWHDTGLIGKYYIGGQLMWSKTEVDALVTTQQPESVQRSVAAMRSKLGGAA